MIPYFILLFIVVILACFKNSFGSKNILKCISIVLVIFAGFRYDVGVDYGSYVDIYNDPEMFLMINEIGFRYLLMSLNFLGLSAQAFFLICAAIMQFFIYKIITYYSENYWYSILIYITVSTFYFASFNGVRQFLAVGCFFYSLRFLDTKSYLNYLLLNVFGAFTFHLTLFLIMPICFIINKKLTFGYKLILIIGGLFSQVLISYVFLNSPYASYLTRERETVISGATYIFVFISFFLILFERILPTFPKKNVFMNMNLLSFIIVVLAILTDGVIRQLLMRMNSYFFIGYIILIPNIIGAFAKKDVRLILYFILTLVLIMYYLKTIILSGEYYKLVPYTFNFNLFN